MPHIVREVIDIVRGVPHIVRGVIDIVREVPRMLRRAAIIDRGASWAVRGAVTTRGEAAIPSRAAMILVRDMPSNKVGTSRCVTSAQRGAWFRPWVCGSFRPLLRGRGRRSAAGPTLARAIPLVGDDVRRL